MLEKKKHFVELPPVKEFIAEQSQAIKDEYADIVHELEANGRLSMPTGEKVDSTLFAIRVIQAGNVRVFYVYGMEFKVFGIHGYVKKTQQIPTKEMKQAKKVVKALRKKGWIP